MQLISADQLGYQSCSSITTLSPFYWMQSPIFLFVENMARRNVMLIVYVGAPDAVCYIGRYVLDLKLEQYES